MPLVRQSAWVTWGIGGLRWGEMLVWAGALLRTFGPENMGQWLKGFSSKTFYLISARLWFSSKYLYFLLLFIVFFQLAPPTFLSHFETVTMAKKRHERQKTNINICQISIWQIHLFLLQLQPQLFFLPLSYLGNINKGSVYVFVSKLGCYDIFGAAGSVATPFKSSMWCELNWTKMLFRMQ